MADKKTTVEELREMVRKFRKERNWNKSVNAKNLAISLLLEASEHLEHYQWMEMAELKSDEERKRDAEFELVDVLYWTLTLADAYGIDLSETLAKKLAKAAKRYPAEEFGDELTDKERRRKSLELQREDRARVKGE